MILINLLPPEFRKEQAKPRYWPSQKITLGIGALFLVFTGIFFIQYLLSVNALRELQSRWPTIQEEANRVGNIRRDMETGVKKENDFLQKQTHQVPSNSAVLNRASKLLPVNLWLVELKISRQGKGNTLLLKGLSLPTPHRSSIQDIEKFLRDLKEHFPKEANLILTTSRQQRNKTELTQFTAVFEWP